MKDYLLCRLNQSSIERQDQICRIVRQLSDGRLVVSMVNTGQELTVEKSEVLPIARRTNATR